MLEFIKRMEQEREYLEGKLKKASKAITEKDSLNLDKVQCTLLQEQIGFMREYLGVLKARICYEKKLHGET